jgi:hypothetical protein
MSPHGLDYTSFSFGSFPALIGCACLYPFFPAGSCPDFEVCPSASTGSCCVSTIARIVQLGNGVDVIPVALVRKRPFFFLLYLQRAWRDGLNCLPEFFSLYSRYSSTDIV